MRLKLINETQWDTRDLRRFVMAGLKAEIGDWSGWYRVIIRNWKGGRQGWAYYNRQHMAIYPTAPIQVASPSPFEETKGEMRYFRYSPSWDGKKADGLCCRLEMPVGQMERFAVVLAHEADHNKNVRHKDMDDSERDISWADRMIADGFRIRIARPVAKKKKDLQAERAKHAAKMLAAHESKLSREKKLVSKWKKKVRYYEKAMATKTAAKKGQSND